MKNSCTKKIAIIDFGSQYTELITKRIRALKVYCEVFNFDSKLEDLGDSLYGIILSGGPNSIYDAEALKFDPKILDSGVPVLGICYGMQSLADIFGGSVKASDVREYGKTELQVKTKSKLFQDLPQEQITVWMSHGDKVENLPEGFESIASTPHIPNAACENTQKKIYGVQFHPEVNHSEYGDKIIENFVFKVCSAESNWQISNFIEESIKQIQAQVKNQKVLLALSGGVDSSTLALLLKKAIGDQLICMYIDHGFMRAGETEELVDTFQNQLKIDVISVNAKARFLEKLAGISDPEQKRKLIGEEFIATFKDEVGKLGAEIKFLAQGTLYSDLIESSGVRINPQTGKRIAATIKSHHNVGGLPEDLPFDLIEPIKTLFKDEVRLLAKELGLPDSIRLRHPFPGPGLAIRILGEIDESKLEIAKKADLIAREEVKKAKQEDSIWQLLTVLLPVKSVGVKGDKRSYAYPIVLRAVTSTDAMTADWAKLPYELLENISSRIVNEVDDVNRVVYDITSKPPGTIEWE